MNTRLPTEEELERLHQARQELDDLQRRFPYTSNAEEEAAIRLTLNGELLPRAEWEALPKSGPGAPGKRIAQIKNAVQRRMLGVGDTDPLVPTEWIEEYNELVSTYLAQRA